MLKRIWIFWMAMLLLLPAAFAEEGNPIAVNFADTAAVISYDGEVLVEPGRYESIFALEDMVNDREGWESYALEEAKRGPVLFAAGAPKEDGQILYALLDERGRALTEMEYEMLSADGDNVLFWQNDRYGAMKPDGSTLVKPEYTMLVSNGEGGFLALTTEYWDEEPDGVYWLDGEGRASATGVKTMSGLNSFNEGLMPVLSAENQLYGYLNAQGQWAIRPQFDFAGFFSGGYAVASLSTGYGVIDRNGNWVVTPKYEYLSYEAGGLLLAQQENLVTVLDCETFAEKYTIQGEALYCASLGNLVQAYDAHSVRLFNAEGDLLNTSDALSSYSYGENGQAILFAGAWGEECVYLLDKQGQPVAGPFQSLSTLDRHEGTAYYCFMTFDARATYSEELGENLYNWDEESVLNGVIDESGRLVLPAEYEELYRLAENRLFARRGNVTGVISLDGSWIYSRES